MSETEAKLVKAIELLATAVDQLSNAMDHAESCRARARGTCSCGLKTADDAVRALWAGVDGLKADIKLKVAG